MKVFNIYGYESGGLAAGNVYSVDDVSPTIKTCSGGNQMPMIVEMYDD